MAVTLGHLGRENSVGKGRGMKAYRAGMTSLGNSREKTGKMSGGCVHIFIGLLFYARQHARCFYICFLILMTTL